MFPSPAPVVPLETEPRSMTRTLRPALVSESAHDAPTIPAPITMASGLFMEEVCSISGFVAEHR